VAVEAVVLPTTSKSRAIHKNVYEFFVVLSAFKSECIEITND